MIKELIELMKPPSPLKIAIEELQQAERELLKAYTAKDYAHNMANYHMDRINRLKDFINNLPKETNA
jgi:hypothetical protein